jgi:hypothetical protein
MMALSEPYADFGPLSRQILASFDLGAALPELLQGDDEPGQIYMFEDDTQCDSDSWSSCPSLEEESDSESVCSDDCPYFCYLDSGNRTSEYVPADAEDAAAALLHTEAVGDVPVILPVTIKAIKAQQESTLLVPQDDPCAFPDDDMLSDNPVSLASMLDGSNLSKEEFELALSMLQRNADVFCFKPSDLGLCTVDFHEIDTGDAPPVKQGFYRMPYQKYLQLKEHIARLLELGIIRESNSPWASPVHLVPKHNGETRMVVDSRRVNAITRKDAYPMPLIDDIVFQLGPCKYLATMDAYCGFNQVALHPDSVPKTAFITPFGLFEYLRLCFGLTNAPACFMRIMNKVLSEQIGKHAFVYLDDIMVYSRTFEDHIEHLELVFESLRQANLRLNPKKCSFFGAEVTFLGFVFTQDGLEPDPRLLAAIANRHPPRNPKEVASWLGLTGYYRRFVKDYARIAAPLTELLKKTNPWIWGAEQQAAFDTMKTYLLTPPCLRRADLSRPFYVHTDASGQAVGAILTQKDDAGKEEWVVAYHSRKLTPAQRNYSISELECLAVIEALCVQWRQWLWHPPPPASRSTQTMQRSSSC